MTSKEYYMAFIREIKRLKITPSDDPVSGMGVSTINDEWMELSQRYGAFIVRKEPALAALQAMDDSYIGRVGKVERVLHRFHNK